MTYRAVIWGIGATYNHMVNTISYFEMKGQLKVVAMTATDLPPYRKIDGCTIVNREEIQYLEYDMLIVMNEKNFKEIVQEAVMVYHIPREKIISYKILQIPLLDLDQYMKLKKSKISIISNNCWGGIVYSTLGMEVLSPFKNLFVLDNDYIKLLCNLKHYMECDLRFYKYSIDIHSQEKYPVFLCDDIKIHCNHDNDIEEAVEKWNRRKKKINWDNLFVEMYTENREIENKFAALEGYENKVCFVPYPSKQENSFSLSLLSGQKEFWEAVNANAANGKNAFAYYLVQLLFSKGCKRQKRSE